MKATLLNSMGDDNTVVDAARVSFKKGHKEFSEEQNHKLSEWYWSGSLDAFADMCKLRLKKDTQEETRHIANQISTQMQSKFPVSWKALIGGSND